MGTPMNNKLLQQAKARRQKLQEEIDELDIIIKYLSKNAKSSVEEDDNLRTTSKTERAAEICASFIKAGNKVTTANQFMSLINNEGVFLSRAGLNQALSRAKLYFNKEEKVWKARM